MKTSNTRWVLGHKVTSYPTSGDYDLMMAETPAHVPGPPPHMHNSYEESFIIVEGEMEFFVNGETVVVKAGESIDVPARTMHTFSNKTDQPCKWVNIHSPKGFLDFFEVIGIPAEEENSQERSVHASIIQKVIEQASDFDMNIGQ